MGIGLKKAIYQDANRPVSERVADLIERMTLPEKVAQLGSVWISELLTGEGLAETGLSEAKAAKLLANGLGELTRLGGRSALPPATCARLANAIQRFLIERTRLGIPAIFHEECCSGYMGLGGTSFPQMIGLASSWEPELAEKMTSVIRQQLRAIGAHHGLAPVLDVARDPRWGRLEETFGEDPTLVSHFGMAYVRGLQGREAQKDGVLATGKHFVGYSRSQGGLNCAPVQMGPRELNEVYLLPFQAAIRSAGLASVMNAYTELDGEVVAASRRILTDVLRGQLGFNGLLVSDYFTIPMIFNYHHLAPDLPSAARMALKAGIDLELPTVDCYGKVLLDALADGGITVDLVDTALSRILQKKFELGLFENSYVDDEEGVTLVFETPQQRSLAHQIALESMVLLKNDGLLPLKKTIETLAVIGPNADSGRNLMGDYTFAAMLDLLRVTLPDNADGCAIDSDNLTGQAVQAPSILESIRRLLPQTKVLYGRGCDNQDVDRTGFAAAVEIAQQADAVVLVLGDRSGMTPACTSGEGRDSADLCLPGVQAELAEAVIDAGKPMAVVLVNGRPLAIPKLMEKVSAVLEAWLPGEEGGAAVAETLFGDANPGGKLPVTFPNSVGQLPIFYNHKPSAGRSNWYVNYVGETVEPLFPFGHGLSYTTFEYSNLKIGEKTARAGEQVDISVDVRNSGHASGSEVVQMYVCDEFASISRPVKELKGYLRLNLQPNQVSTVIFHLPVDMLAFYDENMNLVVEAGKIIVMIGSSSADIRLESEFEISAGPSRAERADGVFQVAERVFLCPVEIQPSKAIG
ncbi:MAG: glycoside hydrolase family 3 N-terminal domain-containing protein [Anaerolineaceae bacterium]|nr:glycoside hydrolase family 3 N-terminal domain-containing protein [Anaerolineaceae bacterium]